MSVKTIPIVSVEVRKVSPQTYLGRLLHVDIPGEVGTLVAQAFRDLYARLGEVGEKPSGPPFLITAHPLSGGMDIEVGVPCARPPTTDTLIAGALPGGRVAVTTHRGAYDKIGPVYAALSTWILANEHLMAGPPREIYMTPPEVPIEEHVTEVQWPIEPGPE